MAVTQSQLISQVLTAIGEATGAPGGPAPYAERIARLIAQAAQDSDWSVVGQLALEEWWAGNDGEFYTDDIKKDLKAKLDAIAGGDTGDAPAADTVIDTIEGHIEDVIEAQANP